MMRSLSTRWKDCRIRFWRANTNSPFRMRNASQPRSKRPASFSNDEPANECICSFVLLIRHECDELIAVDSEILIFPSRANRYFGKNQSAPVDSGRRQKKAPRIFSGALLCRAEAALFNFNKLGIACADHPFRIYKAVHV